jgi:hypothetical protein
MRNSDLPAPKNTVKPTPLDSGDPNRLFNCEWYFGACPQRELPICARYEYARECGDMITAVRAYRALLDSQNPIIELNRKVTSALAQDDCSNVTISKADQKKLAAFESLASHADFWFASIPEFPDIPWQALDKESRLIYVEADENADSLPILATGLSFHIPLPKDDYSDWLRNRHDSEISGWFSIRPGFATKRQILDAFEVHLDTLNESIILDKRMDLKGAKNLDELPQQDKKEKLPPGLFLDDLGGRGGPKNQLNHFGDLRLLKKASANKTMRYIHKYPGIHLYAHEKDFYTAKKDALEQLADVQWEDDHLAKHIRMLKEIKK